MRDMALAIVAAMLAATPAAAQTATYATDIPGNVRAPGMVLMTCDPLTLRCKAVTSSNPVPVTGGSGGGSATPPPSANYVQLALAANTRAQLGTQITGVNGITCTQIGGSVDVMVGGSGVMTTEDGSGNGYPMPPGGGSWSEAISTTANNWFIAAAPAVVACHGN